MVSHRTDIFARFGKQASHISVAMIELMISQVDLNRNPWVLFRFSKDFFFRSKSKSCKPTPFFKPYKSVRPFLI